MSKANSRYFVLLLMLLHVAIAVPMAYFVNIWIDEASTLYTTKNGLVYALTNTLADEKQAPLYFFIMSVWRELSHSDFFARLFSVGCSLLTIPIVLNIGRKFWDERFSKLFAFFFAIHPFLYWASNEIRGYSLALLFSALLLKFFCEGYWLAANKNARILYTAIAVCSLYSNYYLGFFLVGGFAALLLLKEWRSTRNYFFDMLIAGLFFLPMLFVIKSQFDVRTSDYVPPTPAIEGLKTIWNHFLTFVLPTEIYTPETTTTVSLVRLWVVRLGCLGALGLLIAKRKLFDEKIVCFTAITAVIFLFFIILYLKTGTLHIQIRHAAVVFIPVILLAFSFLWELRPEKQKSQTIYLGAAALILISFYSYSIFNIHPNLTKRGDWARVAEKIEKNESENQPIIVFTNYEVLGFAHYYRGKNKVLPDARYFDWNFEDKPGTALVYKNQIEYVISRIPNDANEVWLVTGEDCQVTEACLPLENFVKSNYDIVSQQDFYLERVRLLRKK